MSAPARPKRRTGWSVVDALRELAADTRDARVRNRDQWEQVQRRYPDVFANPAYVGRDGS